MAKMMGLLIAVSMAVLASTGCSSDEGASTSTTVAGSSATSAADTATTAAGDLLTVQVFFLDEDAFNIGRPPYVAPVDRSVPSAAPAAAALDELFAGPTEEERAGGLRFVASEATGVADVRVEDGTAHVTLAGGCSSGGSTFTVADEISATLRQFPTVDAVKIYDPQGATATPDEPGDSIPECLEP